MAVVHYKFKNSVEYDSLTFDGLSISLKDLKLGIMKKKKMRAEDNDLQVVNAQTGEGNNMVFLLIIYILMQQTNVLSDKHWRSVIFRLGGSE
jgi:hypothetical protein